MNGEMAYQRRIRNASLHEQRRGIAHTSRKNGEVLPCAAEKYVSALCKERMHTVMREELIRLPVTGTLNEEGLIEAVKRSFERMDELALKSCPCGYCGDPPCECERSWFVTKIVGSTAMVAVVGSRRVLVANCGDSRAVISRAGVALPMSFNQKPDRLDEFERIRASGGRVINVQGARVNGILAMSRAIAEKHDMKAAAAADTVFCTWHKFNLRVESAAVLLLEIHKSRQQT